MHITAGRGHILVAALAALALGAAPVPAQIRGDLRLQTTRGIGYSGSIPDALVGAGVWQFFGASRVGVFVDGKLTLPSLKKDANYCPSALGSCDVQWVEGNRLDFRLATHEEWFLLNAGALYAVSPQFALQLGIGMARRRDYQEYIDDNEIPEARITWEGNYYVPDGEKWEPQAVAGVLMRIATRFAFTFGIESAPRTMSVGAYLVLP